MAATLSQLRDQLDALQQQYQLHFAGQPRLTRNPMMIKQMHDRAGGIAAELAGIPAAASDDTLATARERAELYRSESAAIEEAKREAGDRGVQGAWLGQRANHVIHRYRRHFAGRSRASRDLGLLAEMLHDLRELRAEMATLAGNWASKTLHHDLGVVEDQVALFQQELREIQAARDAATPEAREGLLAQLANDQFELYRLHFAGQPRVSRRPELLVRMVGNLEAVLAQMEALPAQGFHGEHNPQNIAIVRGRLGEWRQELDQVRQVRSQARFEDVVGELGRAAEVVMQVYNERFAGQDRASRDLALLAALCDRLWDLARQMETLARVKDFEPNDRNLEMVYDLLHMIEAEYNEIEVAKAGSTGA